MPESASGRGGVCSGGCLLGGGGVSAPGGCLLWGVSAWGVSAPGGWWVSASGGCLPGGCLLLGGVCSRGVVGVCFWGVSALGGVCSWGVSAPEGWWVSASGGCLLGGCLLRDMSAWGCLLQGGVISLRGVCVCSQGGVCSGGCLLWGEGCLLRGRGVCSWGGVWYPSMHWGRHPPVNRMTNRCKNITLGTTSLRPVLSFKNGGAVSSFYCFPVNVFVLSNSGYRWLDWQDIYRTFGFFLFCIRFV